VTSIPKAKREAMRKGGEAFSAKIADDRKFSPRCVCYRTFGLCRPCQEWNFDGPGTGRWKS
jgi:hypothetical protein